MTRRLGLRGFLVLLALPLLTVVLASLHTAIRGRRAFREMQETLETLASVDLLASRLRDGASLQLRAAQGYLERGDSESWNAFTRQAWTLHQHEARYLALPLTPEERLAVEGLRTRHRLFEGFAQAAMLRRGSGAEAEVTLLQTAFDERELAQESVSQMIQNRHALAISGAEASAVRNGWAVGLLAGTLLLALALSWTLALRGVLRPLEALQEAARRLERRELGARARVSGIPVVVELGRRFNAMATELEALLQTLEERVRDRTSQLEALESVSSAGLANLDRDALLAAVVEHLADAAQAEGACLRLLEDSRLVAVTHRGWPEDMLRLALPLRGATGRVLDRRRALWLESFRDDEDLAPLHERGFATLALVPLALTDRPLGLVQLAFRGSREPDAALLRVLDAMATRAALGLERGGMVHQLRQTAEELRAANRQLLLTQQRLVEAERLAAVGQLNVALRHEINNPLSVLLGAAEILESAGSDPQIVQQWAAHIGEAAGRISQVLERLEELRGAATTEYGARVAMLDLGGDKE